MQNYQLHYASLRIVYLNQVPVVLGYRMLLNLLPSLPFFPPLLLSASCFANGLALPSKMNARNAAASNSIAPQIAATGFGPASGKFVTVVTLLKPNQAFVPELFHH